MMPFKAEALHIASESCSTQAAAQHLGISPTLLYRWQQAQLVTEVGSVEVARDPEVRQLRAQLKRVEQELDISKKPWSSSAGVGRRGLARPAATLVCTPHHQLRPERARCLKPVAGPVRPDRPQPSLGGDITYLPKQGGGWLYLATWLDRYSLKIVGWDMREDLVS